MKTLTLEKNDNNKLSNSSFITLELLPYPDKFMVEDIYRIYRKDRSQYLPNNYKIVERRDIQLSQINNFMSHLLTGEDLQDFITNFKYRHQELKGDLEFYPLALLLMKKEVSVITQQSLDI